MKFIIATHNKKKLAEMERILNPIGIEVSTAQLQEVDETGTTFAENAYLKANAACKETGLPAIADDSGLAVDSLNGAPGIYSARYAGEHATDLQKMEKLLYELLVSCVPFAVCFQTEIVLPQKELVKELSHLN